MAKEDKENKDEKNLVGCLLGLWSFVVTSPMWLALLFALMQANDMPSWSWVLFWCYVPANLLGIILSTLARHVLQS